MLRCHNSDLLHLMFAQFLRSLLEKFKDSQSKRNGENSYPEKVARALDKTIRDNATHISEECAICLETPLIEDACVTNCAHMFCKACLVGVLKENAPEKGGGGVKQLVCFDGLCPVCQGEVKAKSVIVFSKQREGGFTTSFITDKKPPKCDSRQSKESTEKSKSNDAARQVLLNAVNGAQSSKLTAVVQELHKMWELDPGSKVLVFSQFLGFLDMMETSLSEIGIPFGRLDGKMTLKQRVAALDVFKADPQSKGGSVMLVSMGLGCGLNLVAASSVFIVDPWWNQVRAGRACVWTELYNVFIRSLSCRFTRLTGDRRPMHQPNSPDRSEGRDGSSPKVCGGGFGGGTHCGIATKKEGHGKRSV